MQSQRMSEAAPRCHPNELESASTCRASEES